jgi:serine protease Do
MCKNVFTMIALFPLLIGSSQAAQNWSGESPSQPATFWSDESGSTSYLGVDIADVTNERLNALKLREEKGVEVTMVDQDAPAGKAGIKEHDVILTMNGNSVESAAQLRRMIHETPAGRVVALGVSRDGQPMTVKVQLGDKHKEYGSMTPDSKGFYFEMPKISMPEMDLPSITVMTISSERSGLTVENITPQLGEFLGVKNGNGVLVRSVDKGSRADKAGFRAGDVIVKINAESVHDTSDFSRAVRSRNGNSVNVGLIREKKEQNLNLALPEKKQSGESLDEEESFEKQEMNAQSSLEELSSIRQEIAEARPQIELAFADQQRKTAEALCQASRENEKRLREQTEKIRVDVLGKQQRRDAQRAAERAKDLENRKVRVRREMPGHSFDI